jgi:hypothetical protein
MGAREGDYQDTPDHKQTSPAEDPWTLMLLYISVRLPIRSHYTQFHSFAHKYILFEPLTRVFA